MELVVDARVKPRVNAELLRDMEIFLLGELQELRTLRSLLATDRKWDREDVLKHLECAIEDLVGQIHKAELIRENRV